MRRAALTLSASLIALTATAAVTTTASAADFTWAGRTDPSTMDPHARNTAPVLGFLNNIYEGLMRRAPDMSLEPALAASWEPLGDEGWRFHLREGVTFHNGNDFTADDVLFSYERASSEVSDVRSWFASVSDVQVVDDYTIDFMTSRPDPLFPTSITNFMIMDRDWAVENGAESPVTEGDNYATLNANGTGAFMVVERAPDIETVVEAFPDWWDEPMHNIDRATFTPITSQATAVAALISGEIDFFEPIPLQDTPRIAENPDLSLIEGIEARVIFFGFDQANDELAYSSVEGANPFQDPRVREAVYRAINVDAIVQTIMRGNAQSTGLLVSPSVAGWTAEQDQRLDYDPDRARELLAEAGYPDGFDFMLRCPNDRYINDEAICTAVTGMLQQIGLDVDLLAEPVSQYFTNLRAGEFDMYMLGWSPGTFDSEHPVRFLMATPNEELRLGSWNFGGYSNPDVDELLTAVQTTIDPDQRQQDIDAIHTILREDRVYVPLFVQPLVWAAQNNVSVIQRPDNFFLLRWVNVEE
ncbi:MAG: ABC transporter substrate-binding protein [Pseudomonadota bacterium]